MRGFLTLLRRFQSDERGAFLVLFGLIAIVLIATSGAVVDYTTMEQARTRAQDALDSASLGLQPRIFEDGTTVATLTQDAQDLLDQRIGDDRIAATIENVSMDPPNGTLHLEANIRVPMVFVSLLGIDTLSAQVVSEATRKRLNVELAMVLDNSGSMAQQSRMANLQLAATCAIYVLLNDAPDCNAATLTSLENEPISVNNVDIGIVPFTGFVNVGPENADAPWMDMQGRSIISRSNFDDDDNDATPFTGNVDRLGLYDDLTNVDWNGCVEARPYPLDTQDTIGTEPSDGNYNTLFVPLFAPDEVDEAPDPDEYDDYDNSYLSDKPNACIRKEPLYIWTQVKKRCNHNANNSRDIYKSTSCNNNLTTNTYEQVSELGVKSTSTSTPPSFIYNNPYDDNNYTAVYIGKSDGNGKYTNTRIRTYVYEYSPKELQERLCKYTGNIRSYDGNPNQDCPTNPLTPLTNNKTTLLAAIEDMRPQGFTNIHQGTIWGFHMLTSRMPLTEARPDTSATNKIMIVMTDGENTIDGYDNDNFNRSRGYTAYGYPVNNRLFADPDGDPLTVTANDLATSNAKFTAAMDERTVKTCANAKLAGITVYTIGLNAPNQKTKDMLTACASDASKVFLLTSAPQLVTVFKQIAEELADLRLAL